MLKFYFKEAFRAIGRAKSSFFLSLLSSTISIFLIIISAVIFQLSGNYQAQLKNNIAIDLFLKEDVDKNAVIEIQNILQAMTFFNSIEFIDKDKAAEIFIKETGEDFRKILEYNPLPASFILHLREEYAEKEQIKKIISALSKVKGVDEVVFQQDYIYKLLANLNSVKQYITTLTVILFLISLYIIYSTIKLIIHNQNEEFETMKLVGAKLSAIKIPVIINALFTGFLAGLISIAGFILILNYFLENLSISGLFSYQPVYVLSFFMVIGPLMGFLVSIICLRKISLKI